MNPNAANADMQAQLALLRDIRTPDAINWWPLAPGWWMLAALIVIAVVAFVAWRVLRRYGARYLALRELDALPGENAHEFAAGASMLLRRVALRKDNAVAPLSGQRWAEYLSGTGLSPAYAQYLVEATYAAQPGQGTNPSELRQAMANWIRRQT